MIQQLIAFQQEAHEINRKNGFWEDHEEQHRGERAMLVITELSEAVESHRKQFYANWEMYEHALNAPTTPARPEVALMWSKEIFETYIKDTVGDELADAVIRILDLCAGFKLPIIEREFRKPSTYNFAHDILRVTWYTIQALHESVEDRPEYKTGRDWGYVLAAIVKVAEWNNVDLVKHVSCKLQYNKTRPYKHAKAY